MKSFFISTPIYYVNGNPSVGHAYTTIACDVLARYHRLQGREVFYLTGTDENSQKNVEAAEAAGRGDDIQGYIDDMAATWQTTWDNLDISYDRFIRTTEADHIAGVNVFWARVDAAGDIYQGEYEGLYCKGCESFMTESELEDGNCPIHKKPATPIKESNYFFKLTKYRDALLEHIEQNPDFVSPPSRRNEVISYIKNFMEDVSISRSTMKWGIPVPGDESQRIYVWFDALLNYITGLGFGTDNEAFERRWSESKDTFMVNVVGKDIIKFHCAIWPAMLLSAGIPLPTQVFAHGFFTVDGDKMSKSLGNVVDPLTIKEEYSNDVLRYYVLRDIRFGEDGDFSHERLAKRYETDLANDLGNLTHRVLSMTEKYCGGHVPQGESVDVQLTAYHNAMDQLKLHDALEEIWGIVRSSNQLIEDKKPWELAKADDQMPLAHLLYELLERLRYIALMLEPFMPKTANDLAYKIGTTIKEIQTPLCTGAEVKKGDPLFPRKEV